MSHTDPILKPSTGVRAPGATPAQEPGAPSGSPRFQELLERLQRIAAAQPEAEQIENPEQLQDAVRKADDGFVAAMDLRRQLEDAFHRHSS